MAIFAYSKSVFIPTQTSRTSCESRSVLEYNDPVNYALGKDVFGIKLESVHRENSPCLPCFSHL